MIRLPRKYTANGIDLIISHNRALPHDGGQFSFKSEQIEIKGDKYDDMEILQALTHEEIEATLVGLGCRYINCNNEFMFCFDHNAFSVACNEIARGVCDLINANRGKDA